MTAKVGTGDTCRASTRNHGQPPVPERPPRAADITLSTRIYMPFYLVVARRPSILTKRAFSNERVMRT